MKINKEVWGKTPCGEEILLYTIEKKTPIGCKLVFCRWHNKDSKKRGPTSLRRAP